MIDEINSRVIGAGVNEFKLIEFLVSGEKQGINLVKVKKIIEFKPEDLTKVAQSHATVLGIMEVDSDIIRVLDLSKIYGYPKKEMSEDEKRCVIITEFNDSFYGFVVDNIVKVHRISWESLQPVGRTCPTDMVVGVASVDEGLDIQIIDFETIIEKIFPNSLKQPGNERVEAEADIMDLRKDAVIICADDSKIIRKKLAYVFKKHHFPNVTICCDGGEAYDVLMDRNLKKDEVGEAFTFMVTDIEMPQMNGLTLCKKVKEKYPQLPVLILSSLISQQMMLKCVEVDANAALSKNDMESLIIEIDRLLVDQQNQKLTKLGDAKGEEDTSEGHLKISA